MALLNEVCDEKRFQKKVGAALEEIRNGVHDGLFTAYPGEHNWEIAHRTLMPGMCFVLLQHQAHGHTRIGFRSVSTNSLCLAFGPLSIRGMYDEMHDIATQMVVKWARFGAEEKIHVTDDFTRLTLDSIALWVTCVSCMASFTNIRFRCAMGTRFNSFYHEELHPFVNAMLGLLVESGARAQRPMIANLFMRSAQKKYEEDIKFLRKIASDLLADRRAHPTDKKDLLNAMINGRDPKTGEGLSDESIINNMITFLIAGKPVSSQKFSLQLLTLRSRSRNH